MDDSLFDFFDEIKPKPEATHRKISQKERPDTDFGFDYESVDESNSVASVVPSEINSFEILNPSASDYEYARYSEDCYGDEESIASRQSLISLKSEASISIDKKESLKFRWDHQKEGSLECIKVSMVTTPEASVKSNSDSKAIEFKSGAGRNNDLLGCSRSTDPPYYSYSSTYSDGAGFESLTTTNESRDYIPRMESMIRSGVKCGRRADCGRQKFNKTESALKIKQNLANEVSDVNQKPISNLKTICDNMEQVTQLQSTKPVCAPIYRSSIPIMLKSRAYFQNGELSVNVITDNRTNMIGENFNVNITISHKYSNKKSEKKKHSNKSKLSKGKQTKVNADKNIVENRANWPEFNTAITQEANKRYLHRLGI